MDFCEDIYCTKKDLLSEGLYESRYFKFVFLGVVLLMLPLFAKDLVNPFYCFILSF